MGDTENITTTNIIDATKINSNDIQSECTVNTNLKPLEILVGAQKSSDNGEIIEGKPLINGDKHEFNDNKSKNNIKSFVSSPLSDKKDELFDQKTNGYPVELSSEEI